nr:MAG TPA: hypothetical protein [Caudoviricetes sp.]
MRRKYLTPIMEVTNYGIPMQTNRSSFTKRTFILCSFT